MSVFNIKKNMFRFMVLLGGRSCIFVASFFFQNLFLCFLGLRIKLLLILFKHSPKQSYLKGMIPFFSLICCDLCCRADCGQQSEHSAVRESTPRLIVRPCITWYLSAGEPQEVFQALYWVKREKREWTDHRIF